MNSEDWAKHNCERKHKFARLKAAENDAKRINARAMAVKVVAFRCKVCGSYHVGNKRDEA